MYKETKIVMGLAIIAILALSSALIILDGRNASLIEKLNTCTLESNKKTEDIKSILQDGAIMNDVYNIVDLFKLGNKDFIDMMYYRTLNRYPDDTEFNKWYDILREGRGTKSQVLVAFLTLDENLKERNLKYFYNPKTKQSELKPTGNISGNTNGGK